MYIQDGILKMVDIFDAKILCKNCNCEMKKVIVNKKGFGLRAVQCGKCNDLIVHPSDVNAMDHFKDLKGRTYRVKLRMVGNSHAISIPKEIVNFINEMNGQVRKDMDDMVKLCFEDFGKLSVRFGDDLQRRAKEREKWR
tara:strand:+ start:4668 stop:5084 length:417 start_codon:yes stop_codon:yes gene_type:complete